MRGSGWSADLARFTTEEFCHIAWHALTHADLNQRTNQHPHHIPQETRAFEVEMYELAISDHVNLENLADTRFGHAARRSKCMKIMFTNQIISRQPHQLQVEGGA